MIIGLLGPKRSGKDTVAERLVQKHGFERVAFADALKRAAWDINPYVRGDIRLQDYVHSVGWEVAKTLPEVRRFLQTLGVAMRDHVHPDTWINVVRHRLEDASWAGDSVVVTDVRFPNESRLIVSLGGFLVRLERPGLVADETSRHVSEDVDAALDGLDHLVLTNDGTVEDLWREVDRLHDTLRGAIRAVGMAARMCV